MASPEVDDEVVGVALIIVDLQQSRQTTLGITHFVQHFNKLSSHHTQTQPTTITTMTTTTASAAAAAAVVC